MFFQFKSQGEVHGVVVKSDYLSPGRWYVGVCNYETRESKGGMTVSAVMSPDSGIAAAQVSPMLGAPLLHECAYNFRTLLHIEEPSNLLSKDKDVEQIPKMEPPVKPEEIRKETAPVATPAPTPAPTPPPRPPPATPPATKKPVVEEAPPKPAISGKNLKLLGNLQSLVELPLSSRVPEKLGSGLPVPSINDEQIRCAPFYCFYSVCSIMQLGITQAQSDLHDPFPSETLSQTLKHVQQLRGELLNSNSQSEAWQTKIAKLHSDLSQVSPPSSFPLLLA